ncbi:ABC transporter ATP-binding protein [Salinibius halmophilus]|uniref:ABC transporter ATP-binding protein n=1 Tax=Salinibius halmophilus TaxID=1853216 RepID=UPI000E667E11|nr:ABC transporter ATP-binding protein [Salinibius halmophilus]
MIELSNVSKYFGGACALDNISLKVPSGQLCVLLGSSGCGKSTLLRLINRMLAFDQGEVRVNDKNIAQYDPIQLRRSIGYAIQDTGLFPHWNVRRNIALVPSLLGWSPERTEQRVSTLLDMFGIAEHEAKMPHQLSGGQAQRVGVARALAGDPDVLLMDEPFAALDPITRVSLQDELLSIQQEIGKTIVFVTHDIDEALKLADQLVIMANGCIAQSGSPLALLKHPDSSFVAEFLGGHERGLRMAKFTSVRDLCSQASPKREPFITVPPDMSVQELLSLMLLNGCASAQVVGDRPYGFIAIEDLQHVAKC